MSEWISVKEKLPHQWEKVWVFWRDREVHVGYRTYAIDEYEPNEGWYSLYDEKCRWANYWMPLNKPKKPQV